MFRIPWENKWVICLAPYPTLVLLLGVEELLSSLCVSSPYISTCLNTLSFQGEIAQIRRKHGERHILCRHIEKTLF